MIKKLTSFIAAILLCVSPATAQNKDIPGATANLPTLAAYPDMGQEFGMQWINLGEANAPRIEFASPKSHNRLWSFRCERFDDDKVRIVHQLESKIKDMGKDDRFGFTIRVDDASSLGMIARMELVDGAGGGYYVPRFYTTNKHPLYEALAKGKRAFVNLNGNKFSVHLTGSGDSIREFLRNCR